ncbi:TonB-dependent receptor plug domain-containing protein [Formosa sp. PL04]|uniref:TonB-dependent receptor plug domain-containing protein n=1 Tax=Formosa sp. PL04 TaxID=3081755 RepID=UPI00298106D6|nr:TonB-dependent receptor plug domain-containing protein [Formosa sp. PL04]MDW5290146.1 TonB-dependent receptor plug domain-containing protein [Formosa sp. PL04]
MTRYLKLIFTVFFLFQSLISTSQENTFFDAILGKLEIYNSKQSPEKTYIQTDKDFYITGETIWFKIFLVNGISHTASYKSNLVYLELLNADDNTVIKQKLFSQDFGTDGAIDIPENFEQGNYKLRAYTKYMLNEEKLVLYSKVISINVPRTTNFVQTNTEEQAKQELTNSETQKKPLISFYPEGGNLVSGIPSVLGIKINDSKGNGIALQGKIIDEDNNTISLFESHEFGLGKANFTPDINKNHYASILVNGNEEKYLLPDVKEKGYTLSTQNFGEYVTLKVASNIQNGLEGTMLIGHIRGRTVYKHIEKKKDLKYSLKLLTSKMEDGVANFTLFTAEGEPVCERLVFINNPDNDINFSVKTNSKRYKSREAISVALNITDKEDKSLQGNFTASVITNSGLSKNSTSIKSWLLLNSDIGGTIPNANYFFEEKTKKRLYLLDALMLTHGWRRFIWKDMLNSKVSKTLDFEPEKGIMVNGKTTSFENEYQPKSALVSFTILDKSMYQAKQPTGYQGKFSFGPFILQDTLEAMILAKPTEIRKKARENDLAIYIEDDFPKPSFNKETKSYIETIKYNFPQKYLEQAYKRKIENFKYDPKATQLSEVIINAKVKQTREELINEKLRNFTLYGDADNRIFRDSIAIGSVLSAIDLLRNIAGVQITGSYPDQTVNIRGIGSLNGSQDPLFLYDGTPVDYIFINTLLSSEIMFVDVLKGASGAAMYGSRGGNGVVAFYSYTSVLEGIDSKKVERYPNVTNFKINGFSKTREFFSTNYALPEPKHDRADYRTTLHWLPNINISDSDASNFSFYTGDVSGTYLIRIEGITLDGQAISALQSFEIEEE